MKRIAWLMVATLAVAIAAPAFAGSGGKCAESAQVCLNHWSKSKDKPWAGLKYDTEDGVTKVTLITPGSPAASSGIEVGDVLLALNGIKVTDKETLKKAKSEWKAGTVVKYTVTRSGAEKQFALTLAPMPQDVYASMVGSHMLENHVTTAMADAGTTPNVTAAPAEKK